MNKKQDSSSPEEKMKILKKMLGENIQIGRAEAIAVNGKEKNSYIQKQKSADKAHHACR